MPDSFLGVTVSDLSPDLAHGFGLPEGQKGALIQQVQPKAPAGKAGGQAGDLVVAPHGKPVEGSGQLTRGISAIPPGGKANLQVLREGKKKEIAVTVGTRPDEEALARGEVPEGGEEPSGEAAPEGKPKDVKLGVKLAPLSPEMAREMKLEAGEKGVVVAEVVPDSPAERAGLQRGDLILAVSGKLDLRMRGPGFSVFEPNDNYVRVDRPMIAEMAVLSWEPPGALFPSFPSVFIGNPG